MLSGASEIGYLAREPHQFYRSPFEWRQLVSKHTRTTHCND
jgi:hypothetical protein